MTILAAVSGGVDSILLLTFFNWLSGHFPLLIVVCHLHHGLRKEADEEEAFVRSLADRLALQFRSTRRDVSAIARREKKGIEAAGRNARLEFFHSLLQEYGPDALVALGHHANDQAETVLLNIGRGSGLAGASGMRLRDKYFIRPLLRTSKKEILEVAAELSLDYVTDKSNESGIFLRNRIRHSVLPAWSEAVGFDVAAQLTRFAENIRDDDEALDSLAKEAWEKAHLSDDSLSVTVLRTLPKALQRRVFILHVKKLNKSASLSRKHIEDLFALLEKNNAAADLPGALRAVTDGVRITFTKNRL